MRKLERWPKYQRDWDELIASHERLHIALRVLTIGMNAEVDSRPLVLAAEVQNAREALASMPDIPDALRGLP